MGAFPRRVLIGGSNGTNGHQNEVIYDLIKVRMIGCHGSLFIRLLWRNCQLSAHRKITIVMPECLIGVIFRMIGDVIPGNWLSNQSCHPSLARPALGEGGNWSDGLMTSQSCM